MNVPCLYMCVCVCAATPRMWWTRQDGRTSSPPTLTSLPRPSAHWHLSSRHHLAPHANAWSRRRSAGHWTQLTLTPLTPHTKDSVMGCLEPSECVLGQAVPPVCVYMYMCETCQARDAPAKFFQPPVCTGRGGVAGRPVCMHNNVGEASARLVFVQSSMCIISWQKCRSESFFCFFCFFPSKPPPPPPPPPPTPPSTAYA